MNWKSWVYSIAAGAISGASTSVLGVFAMPDIFNFSHSGWVHIGKLAFIGAVMPVLTFLKQSPLPAASLTTTTTATLETKTTATPE